MIHIHFLVNSAIIMRTNGQDLGIFKQSGAGQILGSIDKEVLYMLFVVCVFFLFPMFQELG